MMKHKVLKSVLNQPVKVSTQLLIMMTMINKHTLILKIKKLFSNIIHAYNCIEYYNKFEIKSKMDQWQVVLIDMFGWLYFLAWSVSFYGQVYTNYNLKRVEGMNLDLVQLNFTGFLFYCAYNTQGYFFDRKQTGEVDINDVLFSYNALFATIICICQSFIYERGRNKVHQGTKIIIAILWSFVIIYGLLAHYTKLLADFAKFADFTVFSLMGYFKLLITLIKYLPQLYWNYVRKSTKGWSIFAVILDFTGGVFSFTQMGLQELFSRGTPWNMVKVLLGLSSIFYDTLFLLQHYYWYRSDREGAEQIMPQSATEMQYRNKEKNLEEIESNQEQIGSRQ